MFSSLARFAKLKPTSIFRPSRGTKSKSRVTKKEQDQFYIPELTLRNIMHEVDLKRTCLPRGYSLVLKGNVYITGNCRKQTKAAEETLYLVEDAQRKQIGIGVPTAIYEDVKQKEVETRTARAANVARRENLVKNRFEQVILQEFPRLPQKALPEVLRKALEKGAGKVGRTGKLSYHMKVQLAVRAHIEHCHTQYDTMVKGASKKGMSQDVAREMARFMVRKQVNKLAASWAGGRSVQSSQTSKASVVITSSASSPPQARPTKIAKSNRSPTSVKA